MSLTSEHVHWIFGAALSAAGSLLLLVATDRLRVRWTRSIMPVALFAFGIELLLDPLVHGRELPTGYAKETAQHFALGLLLVTTTAADLFRTLTDLQSRLWHLRLVPALLIAAGTLTSATIDNDGLWRHMSPSS